MGLSINTNVAALNAQRNLEKSQSALTNSLKRLSSGLRLNSAKDDAAGLAITNRMTAQVRGLNQAVRNANDGISLSQTAEGALQETTNNLQRLRELAVQAANDINTASDRNSIQLEIDQLVSEIDRIANTTSFNGKNILNGSADTFFFQVGANANERIGISLVNVRANSLGNQAGIVQSTSGRISLHSTDDNVDAGTRGVQENGVGNTGGTTAIGDLYIEVAGRSSVDIALTRFGGDISSKSAADLKDLNSLNYAGGMAKDIAERINFIREMQLEDTGSGINGTYLQNVYASAKTTFQASDIVADDYAGTETATNSDYRFIGTGSIVNGALNINGVDIGAVEFKIKDSDDSLTTAINAKSSLTGVEASKNDNGELVLTAEDGRDIIINTNNSVTTNLLFAAGGNSANGPGQAVTEDFNNKFTDLRVTGKITITAPDTLAMTGATGEIGFSTGAITEDNVQAVGSISNADVSTVEGSNNLINAVDSALKQVDDFRAKLGAVQNRFESTISNLQSVSENLSASRSRILDTDFAQETAQLTKMQILQQAGIAMLAQANQLPQSALSLLQ